MRKLDKSFLEIQVRSAAWISFWWKRAKNASSAQSSKVHFPQVEHEHPLVEGKPNLPHGSARPRLLVQAEV